MSFLEQRKEVWDDPIGEAKKDFLRKVCITKSLDYQVSLSAKNDYGTVLVNDL